MGLRPCKIDSIVAEWQTGLSSFCRLSGFSSFSVLSLIDSFAILADSETERDDGAIYRSLQKNKIKKNKKAHQMNDGLCGSVGNNGL